MRYLYILLLLTLTTILMGESYTLERLTEKALKQDIRIQDFQTTQKLVKNKVEQVRALFLPKLSYTFTIAPMGAVADDDEVSGSIDDMDFSSWGVGYESYIKAVQPIYTFGKWSTGMKMAKKGVTLAGQKMGALQQQVKFDLAKAYYSLVMIKDVEKILKYGEKQLKKAQKKLQKLDEEDSDDFNPNDLFRLNIAFEKLMMERETLQLLKKEIKSGLATLLGIKENFSIKDKKLPKEQKMPELTLKNLPERKMLKTMIEINKLDLSLKTRNYLPDLALVATWKFKDSNVANKRSGYDPYHTNSAAVALALSWKFDLFGLNAKHNRSKLILYQNQNRVTLLEKKATLEQTRLKNKVSQEKQKIARLYKIRRNSKKWFMGNAMDYYVGMGKAKDLLDSLAGYQKAKIDEIRAHYNYTIADRNLKRFLGVL